MNGTSHTDRFAKGLYYLGNGLGVGPTYIGEVGFGRSYRTPTFEQVHLICDDRQYTLPPELQKKDTPTEEDAEPYNFGPKHSFTAGTVIKTSETPAVSAEHCDGAVLLRDVGGRLAAVVITKSGAPRTLKLGKKDTDDMDEALADNTEFGYVMTATTDAVDTFDNWAKLDTRLKWSRYKESMSHTSYGRKIRTVFETAGINIPVAWTYNQFMEFAETDFANKFAKSGPDKQSTIPKQAEISKRMEVFDFMGRYAQWLKDTPNPTRACRWSGGLVGCEDVSWHNTLGVDLRAEWNDNASKWTPYTKWLQDATAHPDNLKYNNQKADRPNECVDTKLYKRLLAYTGRSPTIPDDADKDMKAFLQGTPAGHVSNDYNTVENVWLNPDLDFTKTTTAEKWTEKAKTLKYVSYEKANAEIVKRLRDRGNSALYDQAKLAFPGQFDDVDNDEAYTKQDADSKFFYTQAFLENKWAKLDANKKVDLPKSLMPHKVKVAQKNYDNTFGTKRNTITTLRDEGRLGEALDQAQKWNDNNSLPQHAYTKHTYEDIENLRADYVNKIAQDKQKEDRAASGIDSDLPTDLGELRKRLASVKRFLDPPIASIAYGRPAGPLSKKDTTIVDTIETKIKELQHQETVTRYSEEVVKLSAVVADAYSSQDLKESFEDMKKRFDDNQNHISGLKSAFGDTCDITVDPEAAAYYDEIYNARQITGDTLAKEATLVDIISRWNEWIAATAPSSGAFAAVTDFIANVVSSSTPTVYYGHKLPDKTEDFAAHAKERSDQIVDTFLTKPADAPDVKNLRDTLAHTRNTFFKDRRVYAEAVLPAKAKVGTTKFDESKDVIKARTRLLNNAINACTNYDRASSASVFQKLPIAKALKTALDELGVNMPSGVNIEALEAEQTQKYDDEQAQKDADRISDLTEQSDSARTAVSAAAQTGDFNTLISAIKELQKAQTHFYDFLNPSQMLTPKFDKTPEAINLNKGIKILESAKPAEKWKAAVEFNMLSNDIPDINTDGLKRERLDGFDELLQRAQDAVNSEVEPSDRDLAAFDESVLESIMAFKPVDLGEFQTLFNTFSEHVATATASVHQAATRADTFPDCAEKSRFDSIRNKHNDHKRKLDSLRSKLSSLLAQFGDSEMSPHEYYEAAAQKLDATNFIHKATLEKLAGQVVEYKRINGMVNDWKAGDSLDDIVNAVEAHNRGLAKNGVTRFKLETKEALQGAINAKADADRLAREEAERLKAEEDAAEEARKEVEREQQEKQNHEDTRWQRATGVLYQAKVTHGLQRDAVLDMADELQSLYSSNIIAFDSDDKKQLARKVFRLSRKDEYYATGVKLGGTDLAFMIKDVSLKIDVLKDVVDDNVCILPDADLGRACLEIAQLSAFDSDKLDYYQKASKFTPTFYVLKELAEFAYEKTTDELGLPDTSTLYYNAAKPAYEKLAQFQSKLSEISKLHRSLILGQNYEDLLYANTVDGNLAAIALAVTGHIKQTLYAEKICDTLERARTSGPTAAQSAIIEELSTRITPIADLENDLRENEALISTHYNKVLSETTVDQNTDNALLDILNLLEGLIGQRGVTTDLWVQAPFVTSGAKYPSDFNLDDIVSTIKSTRAKIDARTTARSKLHQTVIPADDYEFISAQLTAKADYASASYEQIAAVRRISPIGARLWFESLQGDTEHSQDFFNVYDRTKWDYMTGKNIIIEPTITDALNMPKTDVEHMFSSEEIDAGVLQFTNVYDRLNFLQHMDIITFNDAMNLVRTVKNANNCEARTETESDLLNKYNLQTLLQTESVTDQYKFKEESQWFDDLYTMGANNENYQVFIDEKKALFTTAADANKWEAEWQQHKASLDEAGVQWLHETRALYKTGYDYDWESLDEQSPFYNMPPISGKALHEFADRFEDLNVDIDKNAGVVTDDPLSHLKIGGNPALWIDIANMEYSGFLVNSINYFIMRLLQLTGPAAECEIVVNAFCDGKDWPTNSTQGETEPFTNAKKCTTTLGSGPLYFEGLDQLLATMGKTVATAPWTLVLAAVVCVASPTARRAFHERALKKTRTNAKSWVRKTKTRTVSKTYGCLF